MKYDYTIEYNGIRPQEIGIEVVKRPNIPTAAKRIESVNVPGRNGMLYMTDGAIEDIEIEIEFNFIEDMSGWMERSGKARKWLMSDIDKKLRLSDNLNYYYKVKLVSLNACERVDWEIGRFTAVFTCEGYQYLIEGEQEIEAPKVIYNHYSQSEPTYKITGEGLCTLTVNGKTMTANIGQNLIINTGLMLAYRTDGKMLNTSINGNYDDLYLKEGANNISISTGFDLSITPNWREI